MADKMILGQGVSYTTDCSVTGLNNNVLVVGGSGSGKTCSVIEPQLLNTYESSMVVTVTKRRIVDKYKSMFQKRGYKVLDLNFVDPSASDISYDPLQYISSYSDITFFAESIVKSDSRKESSNADPYWEHSAISLLSAEIAFVLMTKKEPSFADVLELNDSLKISDAGGHIETTLDDAFSQIAEKDPNCFAISCWNSFKNVPIKTAACIYGTLNTTLDTIFVPELRKMIGRSNKLEFEEIADERTVLFITTSAVNPSMNVFVNIFYAQMFKQLFEYAESRPDGTLPIPVRVICDDFATGSKINNFPEYISIFREKKISVMLLIQSESQLESMYNQNHATTIINNCDQYIYLGGMDLNTCRNISTRLNLPLDEVLWMPCGREVIFRRGQKPIVTQRYDIFKDREYLKITKEYEDRLRKINLIEGR